MRRTYLAAIAAAVGVLSIPSHAYYHYVHFGSRTGPFNPQYEKFNTKTVTFFVSDQGPAVFAPNDTFGSLLGQVKQALAAWDSVSTSDLRVEFGGLETRGQISNAAGGDVVFEDLPPGLLGMGAPIANGLTIVRSTVTLARNTNDGAGPSFYEKFFTTAVHEVGHALGLQHTWTSSAMSQDVIRNTSRARPLDADDVAALSLLYGKSNWQADYGSITGRVTFAGTPNGVALASVVAISPNGLAVSTLTNPDGSYRIDGIPPTNYLLYVHPLPPDALPGDDSGIRLPRDQNGQPIPATAGAFATVFFPGTTDVTQALPISVNRGSLDTRNFSVQPRASVTAYDLIAYTFLDITKGTSFWDDGTSRNWAAVAPAFIDATQSSVTVAVRSANGDTPMPQTATVMGGFANTPRGTYLFPIADPLSGRQAVRLDLGIPLGAGTGPRHLVLNYGNDMYVLPAAVNLVLRPVPIINAINSNSDGTVTVSASSLGADSHVYFDGLPATINSIAQNSMTVTPPPGISLHTAIVTIFNSDSQNSTLLAQAPPTYTYPAAGNPQITNISVRSLPAGGTAVIDITAQNMRFIDGQVTLGFGSDDVTVQRLWVTGPNTLRANVAVAGNAFPGSTEVSVISGFQVIWLPGAFTVQSANPALPVMAAIVNGDPAQQTIYPGSAASIYGSNLGQNPAVIQVTLNDRTVPILGLAADHVNIQIPGDMATGLVTVKMSIGSAAANPVAMQIDAPPPAIVRISNSSNVNYDASHFAGAGDSMNIVVTGLDPSIAAQNNLSRLGITVSSIPMTPLEVTSLGGGLYQIRCVLSQGFGSTVVPVAVQVDGSSSAPYLIPIR